jgi:general secretion pathway protein D
MVNKKMNSFACRLGLALVLSIVPLYGDLKQKKGRNTISQRLSGTQNDAFVMPDMNQDLVPDQQPAENTTLSNNLSSAREIMEAPEATIGSAEDSILPVRDASVPFAFTNNSADIPLELRSEIKSPDDEMADALEILNARQEESIEFNFENAKLETLITQIEKIFKVTFIPDDVIEQIKKDSKSIKGHQITFKTHKPLTRDQAWSLFTTFLEIAGFSVVPMEEKTFYRIQTIKQAQHSSIPSFIGTDPDKLPGTDEIIRYVYFIKNSTLDSITKVVNALRSTDAIFIELKEHKAFLLSDKAYNIRVLMQIVQELDQTTRPQSMSVLKLQRADAEEVKKLYESLINPDSKVKTHVFKPQQKPSSLYFPEDMKIIAEPRTNTLILLGPGDAIKKVEEFILKYVDVDIAQPYSPLHVIQLKYADAQAVGDIMREVTKFGGSTPAGINGGVRGGDKYLKPIFFIADKSTNRLIVRGDYDDFLKVEEVVKQLDEKQPQVAIEILILTVTDIDNKQLGAQIRSKAPNGLLGKNVQFQTSGLFAGGTTGSGIVANTNPTSGANLLLGNLISLIAGPPSAGPGNTIINLGRDIFGVWGVFQMLQSISNLHVMYNPFLTATNKTEAKVALGTTRRVVTSTVQGNTPITSQGDYPALLTVTATPQINSDGMISLDFSVDLTQFTNPTNPTDATTTTQKIVSKAIVADQEVLALGGLIRNQLSTGMSETPLLGKLPIIGWFFKNKMKVDTKQNLLILVSARIIREDEEIAGQLSRMTTEHYNDCRDIVDRTVTTAERRDPIHRAFLAPTKTEKMLDDFIFERGKKSNPKYKDKRRKIIENRRLKDEEKAKVKGGTATRLPIKKHAKEINTNLEDAKPMMVHKESASTPLIVAHNTLQEPVSTSMVPSNIYSEGTRVVA